MILYKYLSYDVGLMALRLNTVRFTPPSELNDPFDTVAFQSHPDFTNLMQRVANDSYGVLSLSRSPTNPVIWSHYGHGPVIEGKHGIPV